MEDLITTYDYDFQLGNKVMGTVMEVDEDGAYIEIGAKCTAYVPLHECSFAKLKSVSRGVGVSGCLCQGNVDPRDFALVRVWWREWA